MAYLLFPALPEPLPVNSTAADDAHDLLFLDPEKALEKLGPDQRHAVDGWLSTSPDRGKDLRTLAVKGFLEDTFREPGATPERLDVLREQYAYHELGVPVGARVEKDQFFDMVKEKRQRNRDRKDLFVNVSRQAHEAALSIDPTLPETRKKEIFDGLRGDVPGLNPDDIPALYRVYNDVTERVKFETQPERSAAREAAGLLRKGDEAANFALDYMTPAVERIMKLPKDRRDIAIEFLRQNFTQGGGKQVGVGMAGRRPDKVDSTVEGAAKSLGRGAADVTNKLISYGERAVEALGARDDSEFRAIESKLRELVNGTLAPLNADGVFQEGIMRAAESIPAMGLIAAGPVGTALSVSYYQQGSYEKFKADPRMAGVSEAKLGAMSLASGVAQMALDKVELGILSKLPGASTVLSGLRNVANPLGYVGKEVGKAVAGVAAETAVESLQNNYTDAMAQQVGAWLSPSVAAPEWENVNAQALKELPDLTMAMIPLVVLAHGVGGVRDIHAAQALASTPELLRISGFSASQAMAIASAENPVGALRAMWNERDPMQGAPAGSSPGDVAAQAVEDYKAAAAAAQSNAGDVLATPGVSYVQRTAAGWQVIDTDGQAHTVASEAAVAPLLVQIGKATSIKEGGAMQQIADAIAQREPGATQILTGDRVTVEKTGTGVSLDSALKLLPFDPATVANFNAQLSLLGASSAVVNGANWIAADGAKLLANKSAEGVLTQVHEFTEARFRSLIDQDLEFGNHAIRAAAVVAPLFDVNRGTAEDKAFAARVQRVATGKTNETEARETLVELVVADVLGRRKDGGVMPAGSITAGVTEAMHAATNPEERASLGKFRAFLRAVRNYLRGVFSTAAKLDKGRRDGVIKPGDDFHTFAEKLLGLDAQREHEAAVVAEVFKSLELAAPEQQQAAPIAPVQKAPILVRADRDGSEIRLEFDASAGVPTDEELKSAFGSVGITRFASNVVSGTRGTAVIRLDVFNENGNMSSKAAEAAYEKALGTKDKIRGESVLERAGTLAQRYAAIYDATISPDPGGSADANAGATGSLSGVGSGMSNDPGAARQDSIPPGGPFIAENGNIVTRVNVSDISYGELPGVDRPLKNGDAKPILLERTGSKNQFLALVDGYHRLDGMIEYGEKVVDSIILGESDARALDNNSKKEIERVQSEMEDAVKRFRELYPNETSNAPSSGASASLGSVNTLEALANQIENANAAKTPKERMLAYTALAEDLRGMARAIRFNDSITDAMSVVEIDKERVAMRARIEESLMQQIEADFGDLSGTEFISKAMNSPLFDAIFRQKPGDRFPRSMIQSRTAAERAGRGVGGEYDGASELPRWIFGGTIAPDVMAQNLYDEGLLRAPTPDELWNSIGQVLKSAGVAKERLRKYGERKAEARAKAVEEANAWAEKEKAALPKRRQDSEKQAQRRAFIMLEAMLAKMPAEVRGKIGGFTTLLDKTTDAARDKFLKGRVEKMDAVFEKYLQKEYRQRIRDLFHKAQPKGGSGEKSTGKIGAFGHAWMDYARGAAEMTEAKAAGEIAGIEAMIARDLTPDEIAELGRFWGPETVTDEVSAQLVLAEQVTILEAFGGFDEMTSAELARAYKAADDAYENGRFDWLKVVMARKEFRSFRRDLAVSDAGGVHDVPKHNRVRPLEPVVGLLDMHLSFEQIVGKSFGAETDTHKWTREAARKAQDSETDIIDSRRKEFADFMAANLGGPVASRVKLMALQERVDTGFTGPHAHLSQNQAIHLTMLYRDEASRNWMETHKWTADVMAELEGWLSDDAKAVRGFLIGQYSSQFDRINRVHVKLKGVTLPRVVNYAPRLVEHGGKQQDMAIGQDNAAGMVTGFLRRRFDRPQGPPKLADALVAYWGNQTVVSHWLAWAETMGDFRGTIGSRDARLAVETHQGRAISSKLSRELNAIEEGGVREAIAASEVGGLLRRWFDARSKTALFGKLSVIVKQLPALFGSAAKVRGGKWMSSASRVMSGRAAIGLKEMFDSDLIQRRVSNDSEISALAAKGNKNTPGLAFTPKAAAVVDFAMGKAGGAIGLADAAFTTFSAAVAYDATFREMKEAGMSDDEATRIAWDRTAVVVGQTAQPMTLIDKSLLEVEWPTMGRLIFAFQGANRQAWSLMYEAVRNFKKDPAQAAQTLGLFTVLIPTLTYILGGLVKYATSDDDLEDEFSMKGWGHQIAAAPLQGMIVVGPMWESFWQSTPRQADSPVASDLTAATSAMRKLIESDEERAKRPKDQRDFDGKDLGKILDGLATAIGGRAAAIGVANNVLQQMLGLRAAVTEGDQGRESFQAKQNRADSKKDAKGKR